MRILNYLLLKKEARLFDSKEFLLKAFVAVLLGSLVGELIPYVSKDMISLLFGMMLTLDPVNLTGIRSGLKQVEATVIGAIITGLLLFLFGYYPWTTALAVTATLYVSLLINWREFSVVAVFTSIYMTQYVQVDNLGNPSELETFKLRIAALLTGVAIAFFVNFLFSIFGYRHMLEKRLCHLMDDLYDKMEEVRIAFLHERRSGSRVGSGHVANTVNTDDVNVIENGETIEDLMHSFPALFNNIDWIYGTILDYEKDPIVKLNAWKMNQLIGIKRINRLIREMTHINYDIIFKISKGIETYRDEAFVSDYIKAVAGVNMLRGALERKSQGKRKGGVVTKVSYERSEQTAQELIQLEDNIMEIVAILDQLQ